MGQSPEIWVLVCAVSLTWGVGWASNRILVTKLGQKEKKMRPKLWKSLGGKGIPAEGKLTPAEVWGTWKLVLSSCFYCRNTALLQGFKIKRKEQTYFKAAFAKVCF